MRFLGDWPRTVERGLRTLVRGFRLYTRNGSWRAWVQVASYFFRRLRIKTVHINFPYASGLWAESSEEIFSAGDLDRLRELGRFTKSPLVLFEFPTPKSRCLVAKKSFVYISASGDVTPCPVVPYVIGNVREKSFVSIWKRHADLLRFDNRGSCPVNDSAGREALRAHAASVAARLQGAEPGDSGL